MLVADDKLLLRFGTYAEIEQRPSFEPEVNGRTAKPIGVVGVYDLPKRDWRPCGLSTCHTSHGKGYLVTFDYGTETLVGNECGAKNLGLEFEQLLSRAKYSHRVATDRAMVASIADRREALLEQVDVLLEKPRGGKWIYRRLADARRILPHEAAHLVSRMARHDGPDVYEERYLSAKDIEIRKETGTFNGSRFERVKVGSIVGLEVWNSDLRALLMDDIRGGIEKLYATNSKTDSLLTELHKDAQWAAELPGKFHRVEALLLAGSAFFEPNNLEKLRYLATSDREIKGLSAAIVQLKNTLD
jgi:hypothetical protein